MEYKAKIIGVRRSVGSALILAVVLSTLLAIVGVLFLMAARVNQMSTSAIHENKTLDFAVDSVIADISQQLVTDVPGLPNTSIKQEYYDAPDINNLWLASLEPYESSGNYFWRHISDITGQLAGKNNVPATVVHDYLPVVDINNPVDADGDGVGDSKLVLLTGINSGIGKPVYAAVRIIDNSAMLNVNTGFRFDPCVPGTMQVDVDGKYQTQINLLALAGWAGDPSTASDANNLLLARANNGLGVNPYDLKSYLWNVVWNYSEPSGFYTPFEMSDELELRYRFLLNNTGIDARIETWGDQIRDNTISTPVTSAGTDLAAWFRRAFNNGANDPNYAYRHIATTCNMDRIINPVGTAFNGGKMVNINKADSQLIYDAIYASLQNREPNAAKLTQLAAQLAVNIVDLRDDNTDVTSLTVGAKTYYGLEVQPFISEMGLKISKTAPDKSANNSFAVELYNPFQVDIPLRDFRIELCDANDKIKNTVSMAGYIIKAQGRFVIASTANAVTEFNLSSMMSSGGCKQDPNLVLAKYVLISSDPPTFQLSEKYNIRLVRIVTSPKLYLDKQVTENTWFKWDDANDASNFYSRSDLNWNIVYQEFAKSTNTLGKNNTRTALHKNYNLANHKDFFISIGDIARTLTIGPGTDPNNMLGIRLAKDPNEFDIRLDLKNPVYSNLFQFLTVIDPFEYGLPPAETRIKGRINVNTAPWFVMAQLPWMEPAIARDIVAYRTLYGYFDSIGDLMRVPQMSFYATDDAFKNIDLDRWPDFTPKDGAIGDFEQRDLIFSRISNLVTVRSDIFTAYILVRIGLDGPQKRVIAILDRSRVTSTVDKVRLLALQSVPDPR